jgi:hypothetical protein
MLLVDYRSISENPYVFTNDTSQLSIRTQLLQDRADESIENFTICLPEAQVLRSLGAEAVQPTCVIITIIDDDGKIAKYCMHDFGQTLRLCDLCCS